MLKKLRLRKKRNKRRRLRKLLITRRPTMKSFSLIIYS